MDQPITDPLTRFRKAALAQKEGGSSAPPAPSQRPQSVAFWQARHRRHAAENPPSNLSRAVAPGSAPTLSIIRPNRLACRSTHRLLGHDRARGIGLFGAPDPMDVSSRLVHVLQG